MQCEAKAPRTPKYADIRSLCGTLNIRAVNPGEAEFLSSLYRLIAFGGHVSVKANGDQLSYEATFSGPDGAILGSSVTSGVYAPDHHESVAVGRCKRERVGESEDLARAVPIGDSTTR